MAINYGKGKNTSNYNLLIPQAYDMDKNIIFTSTAHIKVMI